MKDIKARLQFDQLLNDDGKRTERIFTLPANPEAVEKMIEQGAQYIWRKFQQNYSQAGGLPDWDACAPLAKLNTRSYSRAMMEGLGLILPK